MNASQKLDDALGRLEQVEQRMENEMATLAEAQIKWEIAAAKVIRAAKAQKKSDEWAKSEAMLAHPDLYENYKAAEYAVRSTQRVSAVLENLIDGYRSQNANERTLTR